MLVKTHSKHYKKDQWPIKLKTKAGEHNVINIPLVPTNKIILSLVHIKLGLFKQFVKALNKDSFLVNLFPSLAKIKEGVFVGPEIQKLMLNKEFDKMLNINKLVAWKFLLVNKFALSF